MQKTSTNWQNANKPMMNDDQSMSSCRHFAMVWIILSLLNVGKGDCKEGANFFSGLVLKVNRKMVADIQSEQENGSRHSK